MCFHGNQLSWGIKHPLISLWSKYHSPAFIRLSLMLAPVISSLDEIYCTLSGAHITWGHWTLKLTLDPPNGQCRFWTARNSIDRCCVLNKFTQDRSDTLRSIEVQISLYLITLGNCGLFFMKSGKYWLTTYLNAYCCISLLVVVSTTS